MSAGNSGDQHISGPNLQDVAPPALPLPDSGVTQPPQRKKLKTEPANSFLQFVQEKKRKEKDDNPRSKLNMASVRKEWSDMPDENKVFYRELYEREKIELGTNFRNKTEKNKKKKSSIKPIRKFKRQKKQKTPQYPPQNHMSLKTLMESYKDTENKLKDSEDAMIKLYKDRLETAVELAISKTKYQNLTENVYRLKEKLSNVKNMHQNCLI